MDDLERVGEMKGLGVNSPNPEILLVRFVKVIGVMAGVAAVLAVPSFGQETILDIPWLVGRDRPLHAANSGIPFTGIQISYYPNGQKEIEAEFRDGKKDGRWTEWHPNGQRSREIIYRHGKVQYLKEWDPTGNLIQRPQPQPSPTPIT